MKFVTWDVFLALVVFAFVTSITPGPNNVMLMASGVNFGFRRTLPHIFGIGIGFLVHVALKIAGGAYLLYLAWRVAMTRSISEGKGGSARPMTFLEAAAFQWVNVKAWVMAITGISVYSSSTSPFLSVILVAVAFALVNLPCVSTWAAFGVALRDFLSEPTRLKWFNIAMGIALAASLWPMLQ